MELSVAEAAARLGVDRSRVEQLLRAGQIAARRSGRIWLVDAEALAAWSNHRRAAGRPLAPARAWGLLDLLDGGSAAWLPSVARSQVRSRIPGLAAAPPERWRALLRGRSEVLAVRVHPAALAPLVDGGDALVAGPERAAAAGADLVALHQRVEVYVRAELWPQFAQRWHAQVLASEGNLRVHLPRVIWPFESLGQVGPAALAADLLESAEPRAVEAGLRMLRRKAETVT